MDNRVSLYEQQEAASGVQRIDVKAVNTSGERSYYAPRQKIYAKRAKGTFRRAKWIVMAITLGIYYLLPWVRWDRGPEMPNQAFLVDFANQRIFFGPIEIWAQEFYFVTGILVIAALGLFLVTSLAGRVWCGYTCPQTVWTDLMIAVERFWQGDRNARIRLDKSPWTASKIFKKTMTHATFLLVALLTGGAFVLYFRDAPTLAMELVTGTAPTIAYIFLAIFTFTTYMLGGIAREQVCIYMCPWPRIQGAMFDRHSLLVSYREARGEPRGPHRKGDTWEGRGDCIDCKACVAVCPVGIDIRDGPQLECIQCALCIDACNEIMEKINRPKNLIAYNTFASLESGGKEGRLELKPVRARTVLYSLLIAFVGAIMLWGFVSRQDVELNVLRDRNPLFVKLADGGVRNGYTVKILNKEYDTRNYKISVEGLPEPEVTVVGFDEANPDIAVPADDLREVRVYVSVHGNQIDWLKQETVPIDFVVTDQTDGSSAKRGSTFRTPQ